MLTREKQNIQLSIYDRWKNDEIGDAVQETKVVNETRRITRSMSMRMKNVDSHPEIWSDISHYGQCGQSCPCCRARLYQRGIDMDARFGACTICLEL